ncbi:DUF192 domain-containing protein [Flexibacterium corallicola]|uniref:DUF192 domain-containing protein n=1 Tax=Flexibacterium corallicola TaxID=3037259 RepID=UPI00286EC2DB|nr:DUF192 domain-containing protein [Pseudovibrio sp. M1P-2-3]
MAMKIIVKSLLVLCLAFVCVPTRAEKTPELEKLEIETAQGTIAFLVEVAATPEARTQGLMFREHIPADQGMLFVFPNSRERIFWMKNTPTSLDILFINKQKRIVSIARDTIPYSERPILSNGDALYVLEVIAGTSQLRGIGVGDQVIFNF